MKFLNNKWVMLGAGVAVGAIAMHFILLPKASAAPSP